MKLSSLSFTHTLVCLIFLANASCVDGTEMQHDIYLINKTGFFKLRHSDLHFTKNVISPEKEPGELFMVQIEGSTAKITRENKNIRIESASYNNTKLVFNPVVDNVILHHGDRLRVEDKHYTIYIETKDRKLRDSGALSQLGTQLLEKITKLSKEERENTALCFLSLPYVGTGWSEAFVKHTNFVQLRDGRVPNVRNIKLEVRDAYVHLEWDVAIRNIFTMQWQEEREKWHFESSVSHEDDLTSFLECHTMFNNSFVK